MTDAERLAALREEFSKEDLKEVQQMLDNGVDYSTLESTLEDWVKSLRKLLYK